MNSGGASCLTYPRASAQKSASRAGSSQAKVMFPILAMPVTLDDRLGRSLRVDRAHELKCLRRFDAGVTAPAAGGCSQRFRGAWVRKRPGFALVELHRLDLSLQRCRDVDEEVWLERQLELAERPLGRRHHLVRVDAADGMTRDRARRRQRGPEQDGVVDVQVAARLRERK